MDVFTISRRYLVRRSCLTVALLFCGFLILNTSAQADTKPTTKSSISPESSQSVQAFKPELIEKWGIELTALRMTAADHMVDFRYRILDSEKAASLHQRQIKPYLIHQSSGKVLAVPNTAKVGALRNSNLPQEGRIYWMFFGNSGLVKKGDKVTIVIGDFKAEDLVVE